MPVKANSSKVATPKESSALVRSEGRYEDQQRLAQFAVRIRGYAAPPAWWRSRKGMPSWSWLPRIKMFPSGLVRRSSLPQTDSMTSPSRSVTRMQWPGPRSPQDRFDTRVQQTSDRRVQFILGKLGERVTHACLPFLSVPSFLSMA